MIRYSQKVRDILHFIEQYNFITTRICANLFYKDDRFKIDVARRVLNRLTNNGDIVANKNKYGKELIYQFKKSTISDHSYSLLNLYGEINNIVNRVEYFKLEETWNLANRRSDAHIIFNITLNGKDVGKSYLIEYDKHHKTNPTEKYNSIYDSGEVQDWYKIKYNQDNYFPDVIIINYSGKCSKSDRDEYNIIGLDYNFTDLNQKVILP